MMRMRARSLGIAGALTVVFVLALLAVGHGPAHARHRIHTGVYFSFGPYWGWPYPYPYWAYPPPYYVYPPPPVVVETPPVYIQRQPPSPSPASEGPYWYYCESARAYYPAVQACPEPWMRVPPRP